jgi:hypothetical protein
MDNMSLHHVNAAIEHHRAQQQQRERHAEWHRLTQDNAAESSALCKVTSYLASLVSGLKSSVMTKGTAPQPQPSEAKL